MKAADVSVQETHDHQVTFQFKLDGEVCVFTMDRTEAALLAIALIVATTPLGKARVHDQFGD